MLKRSGFKKKSYEEQMEKLAIKKSKKKVAPKKKKSPIQKLKKQLWELCKQIIRLKYGNVCYTCGARELVGSNWHTAHFVASSVCGAYLRYDLRNLRPGCYRCNISLAGNGAYFYKYLVEREGQEYVDQIFQDKQKIIKADELFYIQKIEEYGKILDDLLLYKS